jgi:hypothetical protein
MHDSPSDDPGRNTKERMADRPPVDDADLDTTTIGVDNVAEAGVPLAVDDV